MEPANTVSRSERGKERERKRTREREDEEIYFKITLHTHGKVRFHMTCMQRFIEHPLSFGGREAARSNVCKKSTIKSASEEKRSGWCSNSSELSHFFYTPLLYSGKKLDTRLLVLTRCSHLSMPQACATSVGKGVIGACAPQTN